MIEENNTATSPAHLSPSLLVAEVLERWPQTVTVFLKHRMNCIGCEMSVFEALSDAARIYGISSEQFILDLELAVANPPVQTIDADE